MPVTITVNAETQAAAARIAEFFRGTGEGLERLSGASEFLKEWGQRIVRSVYGRRPGGVHAGDDQCGGEPENPE
jgi:hypothetical protein